ncbi:MAG TPA: hypothetical protein DCM05_16630 [Elusimicrobia bacterium]|nr:hypothetical protein [Elusimicrobiota bacterium]
MCKAVRSLLLVLSAGAAACAPKALVYQAPDFAARAPASVAVLPFDNATTSLLGPVLLRKKVAESLRGRGWQVKGEEETDSALQAIGLTDGGQINAFKPEALAQALSVDGYFWGSVERFSYRNVGFFSQRAVELTLKLVEPKSGESLWEGQGQGLTVRIETDKKEAGKAFVEGLAVQALETMLGSPLVLESDEAVSRLLSSLPGR